MRRLRPHLTYANVTATIALFVALGGSSYATLKISGSQIKNRSITGKKIRGNTLGGREINESRLGLVPNAQHARSADSARTADSAQSASLLAGLDPGAFERSDNVTRFGPLTDAAASVDPTFTFGPFRLRLICDYTAGTDVIGLLSNEPHAAVTEISTSGTSPATGFSLPDMGATELQLALSSKAPPYIAQVEGWAAAASGYRAHVSLWFGKGLLGSDNSTCGFGGEIRRG